MNWRSGLSQAEKDEIYLDLCSAFAIEVISETEFRKSLAELGYNAIDINDCVQQHQPKDVP